MHHINHLATHTTAAFQARQLERSRAEAAEVRAESAEKVADMLRGKSLKWGSATFTQGVAVTHYMCSRAVCSTDAVVPLISDICMHTQLPGHNYINPTKVLHCLEFYHNAEQRQPLHAG